MTDLATDPGGTRTCPNGDAAGRLVLAHDVPPERPDPEARRAAPDEG